MDDSTRRRFVRTTALVSIGALAGCGGDDGGGAQAPNETNETGADGDEETADEEAGDEVETTEEMSFGDPRAQSK